jgi:hypothetical protein
LLDWDELLERARVCDVQEDERSPLDEDGGEQMSQREAAGGESRADAQHRDARRSVGDEHDGLAVDPIDQRSRRKREHEPRHGAREAERSRRCW